MLLLVTGVFLAWPDRVSAAQQDSEGPAEHQQTEAPAQEDLEASIRDLVKEIRDVDRMSTAAYGSAWQNLISFLLLYEEFERVEEYLHAEAERLDGLADDDATESRIPSKRILMRLWRSRNFISWAESFGAAGELTPEDEDRHFELLKLAFEQHSEDTRCLELLTRLACRGGRNANAARDLYNPEDDLKEASVPVLTELGHYKLGNKDFDSAVEIFEAACAQSPDNAVLLNNLAWCYLWTKDPDLERSLSIANEAINALQNIENPQQRISLMTYLFDTKGLALENLQRFDDAVSAYENALRERPDNLKIIKRLIFCMENCEEPDEQRLAELKAIAEEDAGG
ncbi:MAG: tetratricopeptide repeat protein [Planctomycetota bacterium]